MKLKLTLAASLFAVIAALSLNASAVSDIPADAKAKVEKAAPHQAMRPHSHAEVKTGFSQKAPEAKPDKPSAAKDMSKHFHPRDGK